MENKDKKIKVKQYDKLDAQVISLFLQNKMPNERERNIKGVYNTNTYDIKKGILKYGKRAKKQSTKN